MLKTRPADDYPPEEGRYVRGNDYSPVAVCVILDTFDNEARGRINFTVFCCGG